MKPELAGLVMECEMKVVLGAEGRAEAPRARRRREEMTCIFVF